MSSLYGNFDEIDRKAIKPEGWIKRFLETQRDGLTGHIEAAGYPFDTNWWGCDDPFKNGMKEFWGPYEQTAYWLDGALNCGYFIQDEILMKRAVDQIEYVLNHPDRDGYLGPEFLKNGDVNSRWVHVVFFRVLMAYYSITEDQRILQLLTRHYLSNTRTHADGREVCNAEVILWVYGKTGDERLKEHALKAFEGYNRLHEEDDTSVKSMASDKRGTEHGVTYNEIAKMGAIMFLYTGKREWLEASLNAYKKLVRDQMLVDGVHSCSEHLRGKDPLDSHETCDIADYTWSLGYLLMATGDAQYADRIERVCFNAAIGAVKSDFKALQYFSCPNQVIADKTSNHNLFFRGHSWMSYRPNPGTECCPGDVNRIMPNYAARMWMKDKNNGLAVILYGSGSVTAMVGEQLQNVTIIEETDYPFSETIKFTIKTGKAVEFPFSFRIPGWCKNAHVSVNGKRVECDLVQGTFHTLFRRFEDGDCIELTLPMELKLTYWPVNGIAIERGPLVYSLKIQEDWRIDPDDKRSTPQFPAWNLYPASQWNYALDVDEGNLDKVVQVVHKGMSGNLWDINAAPVELLIPAKKVKGWDLDRCRVIDSENLGADGYQELKVRKLEGDFAMTPQLPDPNTLQERLDTITEMITLVPYGCTHLRMTVFPKAR
ncbi:MAG: glycoside hydrolase family 127 protein [Clostridiales bacterium]|nr:glycoside hydrolase family 127 protein [Clostridiales bacterium]